MSITGETRNLGIPSARREVGEDAQAASFDLTELKDEGGIERIGELNPYVTLACDLRCNYCYMYPFLQKAKDISELMPRVYLDGLTDHLINTGGGLDRMTFLGGEPTLHPEITEMINDAADKDIRELRMTTNGIGLHHLDLDSLHPGAFDHVSVSIDGIDAETNDMTRGRGTFKKIITTMARYAEANVALSINYTVTNNNLDTLAEVPGFFKEQGVSILNFHRASLSGNAYNNPGLIVQGQDWVVARDGLLTHIRANSSDYSGLKFRVPYIFLTQDQIGELEYRPIQDNNYHSPGGGHRLIALPPTEKGKGLCYMSSDLIGEPHAELGNLTADGKFKWNFHPNNELAAFKSSNSSSANISTIITGQEGLEHDLQQELTRVSHSFKETIEC